MTAEGKLHVVTTVLEMTTHPLRPTTSRPKGVLALLHARRPTVSFYRYLYDTAGEAWFWWERRALDDDELLNIIHDDLVEIYVLYVDGVPGAFAELDLRGLRRAGTIDLSHAATLPEFLGRGYGHYLLTWTIDTAWRHEPKRLTARARSLDHPRATALLQRLGFTPCEQHEAEIDDPRRSGLIPPATPLPKSAVDHPPVDDPISDTVSRLPPRH